ncbi:MAG: hypothetical protein J07HQX50_01105 [Haloquadratum sp. J07HQX50]|jgi:hypothetical protein|nr:MAG: hypothetical protein J07HQX50_01105 [Haloquadratum sp. J07HQX50]
MYPSVGYISDPDRVGYELPTVSRRKLTVASALFTTIQTLIMRSGTVYLSTSSTGVRPLSARFDRSWFRGT